MFSVRQYYQKFSSENLSCLPIEEPNFCCMVYFKINLFITHIVYTSIRIIFLSKQNNKSREQTFYISLSLRHERGVQYSYQHHELNSSIFIFNVSLNTNIFIISSCGKRGINFFSFLEFILKTFSLFFHITDQEET